MRLYPDSDGLREGNDKHEPKGTADRNGDGRGDGGQFARTDEFDGLVTQALNRMDDKGETAAEAAEAVTGGNRALDAQIVRALQGEATPAKPTAQRILPRRYSTVQTPNGPGVVTGFKRKDGIVTHVTVDHPHTAAGKNFTLRHYPVEEIK